MLISLFITFTLICPAGAQVIVPDPLVTESQIFQSNPEALRSGGMANSLLIMSLATLGSVMISTCTPVTAGNPLPPSLLAFSEASAAYVLAEVTAARAHKADIAVREAAIRTMIENLRRRGGGDIQRITFEETKKEQEYLLAFIDMRRTWLMAATLAFLAAASEAQDEASAGTTDFDITCTGTLGAAFPVATELGLAYAVSDGPEETVAEYLGGVLPIVAAQILPLSATPDGRSLVASIAASTATSVLNELSGMAGTIQGNISRAQIAIESFDEGNGVAVDSGLRITQPPPQNNPGTPAGETTDAGVTPQVAAAASGEASLNAATAASSAANIQGQTCAEKNEAKKSLDIKSECKTPVVFPVVKLRTTNPSMKSAVEATTKFANALAAGNIKEANLAAATINQLAAKIIETKVAVVKKTNLARLKRGKPMQDLDGETKKLITKMTAEIKSSVSQKGGAKLLASTTSLSPAMPAKKDPVKDSVEMTENLPPRLRGKYHYMNSTPQPATVSEVKMGPVKEVPLDVANDPALTLWQQLSGRYQNSYGRLLKRKSPQP